MNEILTDFFYCCCLFDLQDLAVGGVVFRREVLAKDADAGINALVEYRVVPNAQVAGRLGDASLATYGDGYGTFEFKQPHQPVLTLVKAVDYETVPRYLVTIVASVCALILSFENSTIFLNLHANR